VEKSPDFRGIFIDGAIDGGMSRLRYAALDMTVKRWIHCARHDVLRCAQNDDQRVRHFDPPRRRKSPDFRGISLDGAIDEGVSRLLPL
jgi:hypothetical protein